MFYPLATTLRELDMAEIRHALGPEEQVGLQAADALAWRIAERSERECHPPQRDDRKAHAKVARQRPGECAAIAEYAARAERDQPERDRERQQQEHMADEHEDGGEAGGCDQSRGLRFLGVMQAHQQDQQQHQQRIADRLGHQHVRVEQCRWQRHPGGSRDQGRGLAQQPAGERIERNKRDRIEDERLKHDAGRAEQRINWREQHIIAGRADAEDHGEPGVEAVRRHQLVERTQAITRPVAGQDLALEIGLHGPQRQVHGGERRKAEPDSAGPQRLADRDHGHRRLQGAFQRLHCLHHVRGVSVPGPYLPYHRVSRDVICQSGATSRRTSA